MRRAISDRTRWRRDRETLRLAASPDACLQPIKPAWSVEDATGLIQQESGQHFDPELVEVFMDCLPEILEIREHWADIEPVGVA